MFQLFFILLFFSFYLKSAEIITEKAASRKEKLLNENIHRVIHLSSDFSGKSALGEMPFAFKSDSELSKHLKKQNDKNSNKKNISNSHDDKKIEEKKDEVEKIDLNFDSINLTDLIRIVAAKKNISYYISKDLENIKLPPIKSFGPKTVDQLWEMMLTFLKENGLSHEERTGLHLFSKEGQIYPLFSSKETAINELPDSDQTLRYLFYLKNLKADFAISLLKNFLTEQPLMIGDLDVLLIKEKSRTLKLALSIIENLDVGGVRQELTILPLEFTDPETVAKFLTDEISGNAGDRVKYYNPFKKNLRYFSSDVKIFPYPEKKSLIFLGQSSEINRLIHFIKLALDVNISQAQSRVHIKEIKHHSPEDLKNLLQRLLKPNSAQDQKFKEVNFIAETPSQDGGGSASNRIIVTCNKEEWDQIELLIEKLDKPTQTLAIEIMLIDTALDLQKELSGHVRDAKNGLIHPNLSIQTNQFAGSVDIGGQPREYPLKSGFLNGNNYNVMAVGATPFGILAPDAWAFIKQLSTQTNSAIVYQPFIVTKNNEQGVWDQSESKTVDGALEVSGVKTSRTRASYVASNRATVTPRLNLSGLIDLSAEFTISEFIENSGSTAGPDRTSRTIETKATIGIGEVLALAGFDKSKLTKNKYSVPILGSIPIIGTLFRSVTRRSEKQNMYAFIRVSAMKQEVDDELDDYTALKVKYAKYQLGNVNNYSESRDPMLKVFFKPRHSTVKEAVSDYRKDRFGLIDDFVENKDNPINVKTGLDPDFNPDTEIAEVKRKDDSFWVAAGYRDVEDPLKKLKSKRKAKNIIKVQDIKLHDPELLKNYITPA